MKVQNKNAGLTALVVEGGAMRGIFSTGVLDAFLANNFNPFDLCIGVSAGSTNIAAYLAQMYQRNFKVYTDYSIRPDFINLKKFILSGHLVDLDWLWNITIKEMRLDLDKICNSGKDFYVGVTEVNSGKAVYLKPDKNNIEEIIKASSSIPIFYRNSIKINDIQYVDGGLADPIPVMEAYKRNAKNIMVLRSRPYNYIMKPASNKFITSLYLRKSPALLESAINRPVKYQEAIDFMRNPPKGVNIIEVNPPDDFKTGRLTRDISILKQDYEYAYNIGKKLAQQWIT